MTGKPNLPTEFETQSHVRGSAEDVPDHYDALDQERAASMGDEGGRAAYKRDKHRQSKKRVSSSASYPIRWPLVALGVGVIAAATWFAMNNSNSNSTKQVRK